MSASVLHFCFVAESLLVGTMQTIHLYIILNMHTLLIAPLYQSSTCMRDVMLRLSDLSNLRIELERRKGYEDRADKSMHQSVEQPGGMICILEQTD